MKAKTSITLSQEVLKELDELLGPSASRSSFIERVLRSFIRQQRWIAADARDLEILNRHADELNAEAAEVLEFQASLPEV